MLRQKLPTKRTTPQLASPADFIKFTATLRQHFLRGKSPRPPTKQALIAPVACSLFIPPDNTHKCRWPTPTIGKSFVYACMCFLYHYCVSCWVWICPVWFVLFHVRTVNRGHAKNYVFLFRNKKGSSFVDIYGTSLLFLFWKMAFSWTLRCCACTTYVNHVPSNVVMRLCENVLNKQLTCHVWKFVSDNKVPVEQG